MIARATTSLAVAATVALAIAGCGGGEEDDAPQSTGPPSLSKAEFIKRANAACSKERAGLAERMATFKGRLNGRRPEPYADAVHFVFLPTVESEIRAVETVGVPAGEKERLRVLLAADRTAVDAVAVTPKVPSVAAAEEHFKRADRMFRAYGLSACAHGS